MNSGLRKGGVWGFGCVLTLLGCGGGEGWETGVSQDGVINGTTFDPLPLGIVSVLPKYIVNGVTHHGQCTGTLIRNYAVITAKHCVHGPFNTSLDDDFLDHPEDIDLNLGSVWTVASRIYIDPDRDVALIFTRDPFIMNGSKFGYSRSVYTGTPNSLNGQSAWCYGYGYGTADGQGLGAPRKAQLTLLASGTERLMVNKTNGKIVSGGDSGSTCIPTSGPAANMVTGILSFCDANPNATQCTYAAGPNLGTFVNLVQPSPMEPDFLDEFTTSGATNYFLYSPPSPVFNPYNWSNSGGKLVQNSNIHSFYGGGVFYPGTHAIHPTLTRGDGNIAVHIQSVDNDAAGILFRYLDEQNYYRVSVDQERHYIRLSKVVNGVHTTLAENTNFNFSHSVGHTLFVRMLGNAFGVRWDGAEAIGAFDDTFKYGRVGLYSWGLHPTNFDNLTATTPVNTINEFAHVPEETLNPYWQVVNPAGMQFGPANWNIANGKLNEPSNAHAPAINGADPGTMYIETLGPRRNSVYYAQIQSTDNDGAGIVARYKDANNFYVAYYRPETQKIRITKRVNGTYSVVAEAPFLLTHNAGHVLKFQLNGSALQVDVDGTVYINATDTSHRIGAFGFYDYGTTELSFDYILAGTVGEP